MDNQCDKVLYVQHKCTPISQTADSRSGDGSTSVQELTSMNGDDYEPTLSPDGPDHEGPSAHMLGTDIDQSQLISGGLSDEPKAKVVSMRCTCTCTCSTVCVVCM